ncbi:MAG: VCBS repeat-containing protein, partial [Candidatus Neomarinimicrobiota bacterium]|nr:VCBS repeat-containing protein [Candidatus Neomarinimicrobiota bacterium]
MKKIVISIFVLVLSFSIATADGGFMQTGVAPSFLTSTGDSLFGGVPYDAGRGILSGTDLDGDQKEEVWITSYSNGGQVFCFEEAGTDTFAFVWASAEITADYSSPRDVHTGDLDGDGNGEIIFHVGRWTGDTNPDAGIHIYEWDGTDNGYGTEAAFQVDLYSALNDSLNESRVEGFSVGDIDGDGMDEILLANNGSAASFGTQDGST